MAKSRDNAGNIVIREYEERDEAQILPLLRMVLAEPEQYNEAYWRWMYQQKPAEATKIWLAFDDKRLVGHYALVANTMNINSRRQVGVAAINIAVHHDYQGRGIFSQLVARAAEEASREGIAFTFVFPNERSYPIFTQKLGWFEVCSLRELYKPLDVDKIVKRRFKGRYLRKTLSYVGPLLLKTFFRNRDFTLPTGVSITEAPAFDERVDVLCEKAAGGHNISIIRNRNYLNWRYVDRPTNSNYTIYLAERGNEVLGYIVLKLLERAGVKIGEIMDILALPEYENISGCLISTAAQHYRESEVEALYCQILRSNPYYQSLRRNGFIPLRGRGLRLLAHATSAESPQNFISDSRNWFLTRGDETTK